LNENIYTAAESVEESRHGQIWLKKDGMPGGADSYPRNADISGFTNRQGSQAKELYHVI
jgi:hypothetical protein